MYVFGLVFNKSFSISVNLSTVKVLDYLIHHGSHRNSQYLQSRENAIDDIAVHGAAISNDDFTGGADRVTYQIDTSGYSGPFTITVRLFYQSVSYQSMQDLLKGNDSLIERFADLYKDADKMPVQIAIISQTVS
jgi:hypothetical protein